jgi:DNA-directed RNA polymerase sigma subunit (sigma70/sigma32)
LRYVQGDYRVRMIVEMRKQGDTLKIVGLRFGLCRERVRQIVAKHERQERARRKLASMRLEQVLVK